VTSCATLCIYRGAVLRESRARDQNQGQDSLDHGAPLFQDEASGLIRK
jgi:hypothetical protein